MPRTDVIDIDMTFRPFGTTPIRFLSDRIDHGLPEFDGVPVPITLAVEDPHSFQCEGEEWAHVALTVYRLGPENPSVFRIGVVNLMVNCEIRFIRVRWWAFPVA